MRHIEINKSAIETSKKNQLTKTLSNRQASTSKAGYFASYEENVFPAAREALTTGKFHDMFAAGDGHELQDYTDEKGIFHFAHAKSVFSSSMPGVCRLSMTK